MPLRDHFRSPVKDFTTWNEFHGQWPGEIVRQLTTILPPGFRAGPKVYLGTSFEVDIGTFDLDERDPDRGFDADSSDGGTATLTTVAPTLTMEADALGADEYEVRLYDVEMGRQLVAAIELVSPGNKDRPEAREQFVAKVKALLQQGVCVSIVDLVTIRQANLYAEFLETLGRVDTRAGVPDIYAVTLRTRKAGKRLRRTVLDAWNYPMAVGQPLPTLPIWLGPNLRIELPLETSYQETCRILGIG